ncbi:TonB-dependent receptor [Hymenobacter mucosus]|uniref:Iron complex outermembrane recepter protein n=1 Tax=Hymenobacter mucosus TaxID=1411120 RepID=A0A238ZYA6_9BACT|nr:TonB-dependent receptor [Hymenobacter mucosus]SNR88249.1 iron complex outermembrane recepter protein [Hymenobacter mucosus]
MRTPFTRSLLAAGLSLALPVSAALAQAPATGQAPAASPEIRGTLRTDAGEALAGATVTVVHLPTGTRRTTTTDATGQFSMNALLAGGPYLVQLAQPGYRPRLLTNVFLLPDKPSQYEVALSVATVAAGTRRADRTQLDAVAPVDVVDMRQVLPVVPQSDVTDLLNYLVPSFNSTRQTLTYGTDHVDVSSLRGLAPDQTLVLLNGKRVHTTGLINLIGNRGVGSVGTDLNALSANALDRVEVLRDGAAAQYGSDAIAGVMNFQLKADNQGGNVLLKTGLTSRGDGLATLLSVNKGLKLGEKGFLNLTADADYRGYTSRGYARDGATQPVYSFIQAREDSFLRANNRTYADYEQRNGEARMLNLRGMFNAGRQLNERTRLYAFGGYAHRRGQSASTWVLPSVNPREVVNRPGYQLGYQPLGNSRIHDAHATLGAVRQLGAWSLDVSHTFGLNRMYFDVTNSVNPTMGATSPTDIYAGGFGFTQNVSNATLSRLFSNLLAGTNVAVGGEYRTDAYAILPGEPAAYTDYGQSAPGTTPGSQGFLGYSPQLSVEARRQNAAAFLDVEADVTKKWTVGTSLRVENYSDFGSAFIYKVSTRLALLEQLALRAGFNTGFRAPALQQSRYRQLIPFPSAAGTFFVGILENAGPAARAAGIADLKAETSRNLNLGLALTPTARLAFTADAYQIDIDDRIVVSNLFGRGAGLGAAFDQALTSVNMVGAQFYTNSLNTRTRGLDLVATYRTEPGRHNLGLTAAANLNQTRQRGAVAVPASYRPDLPLTQRQQQYLDPRQLSLLTTGSPAAKVLLSVEYQTGKVGAQLRNTYFGEVAYYDNNFEGWDFGSYYLVFRPKVVTDLMLTYKPTAGLQLTGGASNLLNVLPDNLRQAAANGRPPQGFATTAEFEAYFRRTYNRTPSFPYNRDIAPYQSVQMGTAGAFFYLKAAYTLGL